MELIELIEPLVLPRALLSMEEAVEGAPPLETQDPYDCKNVSKTNSISINLKVGFSGSDMEGKCTKEPSMCWTKGKEVGNKARMHSKAR